MDISDAEYKCASCRLIFNTLDDQRGHYKTDLHRFNLKRKVAGLPPILQEVFDKKITEIRAKQEDSEREQSQGWFCESCNKSYSSENAHRQHMNSKKHFERVASLSKSNQKPKVINATQLAARQEKESKKNKSRTTEDNEVSTKEADELEDIAESTKPTQDTPMEEERTSESHSEETEAPPKTPEQIMEEKLKLGMALKLKPTDCLFCRKSFDSLEASLEHMTKDHGFFIPDIEYLVDLPGMIAYLGEKVGLGNTCIYCNKSFISAEAVRGHMSSLSHCKLLYDDRGAAELEDFYNFLPSYFEGLDEEAKKELEAEFARQAAPAASGATTSEEGEIRALEAFAKKHAKAKISEDGYELILEDGRVIGHRALQTYYKQKVKASDNLTESQRIVKNMMSRYQALGWTTKASQHPSGVDPDFLRERRLNSDSQMRLGVKGNKLFIWRRQYGF